MNALIQVLSNDLTTSCFFNQDFNPRRAEIDMSEFAMLIGNVIRISNSCRHHSHNILVISLGMYKVRIESISCDRLLHATFHIITSALNVSNVSLLMFIND